MLNISNPGFYF